MESYKFVYNVWLLCSCASVPGRSTRLQSGRRARLLDCLLQGHLGGLLTLAFVGVWCRLVGMGSFYLSLNQVNSGDTNVFSWIICSACFCVKPAAGRWEKGCSFRLHAEGRSTTESTVVDTAFAVLETPCCKLKTCALSCTLRCW